jgi:hypothetical protein
MVPYRSLTDQAISLIAPWSTHQYPGKRRALAELIGVKVSTARTYLRGAAQLPAYHAERLARYHEQRANDHMQMAGLLREHAWRHGERVKRLRGRALMLARMALRDDDRPV